MFFFFANQFLPNKNNRNTHIQKDETSRRAYRFLTRLLLYDGLFDFERQYCLQCLSSR